MWCTSRHNANDDENSNPSTRSSCRSGIKPNPITTSFCYRRIGGGCTTDNSQLPSPSPTIIQPQWHGNHLWTARRIWESFQLCVGRGAGRRSRLPRQSHSGPPEQSENTVSWNQTPQAVAYGPQSPAFVNAPSHGVQPALQAGQQNELPNSSHTTLPTSNLPAATRDFEQRSRTLPGVRPSSPDKAFPTETPWTQHKPQ
jgi:hypothetical protein